MSARCEIVGVAMESVHHQHQLSLRNPCPIHTTLHFLGFAPCRWHTPCDFTIFSHPGTLQKRRLCLRPVLVEVAEATETLAEEDVEDMISLQTFSNEEVDGWMGTTDPADRNETIDANRMANVKIYQPPLVNRKKKTQQITTSPVHGEGPRC